MIIKAVPATIKRMMLLSRSAGHETSARGTGGFSLIELLLVIALATALVGMGVASFTGLAKRSDVDNQAKRIHADLSNVKIMAMSKGRTHFVALNANGYTAYDDNSPAPDGDDALTVGTDATVMQSGEILGLNAASKQFFPIAWNGDAAIGFNARGLRTNANPVTVCIFSDARPRYDCVNVASARITLGKLLVQGVCSEANCQIQ
jgi:Tfp pilus assembly protein FimT